MTAWRYERAQIGVAFIVMEGERFVGAVDMEKDAKRIVDAVNAAPDLLKELKLANKIIMNALNVMTADQKLAWDELNTRDDLKDGLALTRNGAREAAIARAEGRA